MNDLMSDIGLRSSGKEICGSLATLYGYSTSFRLSENAEELHDTETHEYEIRNIIENHGFTYIGEGTGRTVYEVPPEYTIGSKSIVVKFARPFVDDGRREGLEQNKSEVMIWENEQNGDIADLLCSVLDYGEEYRYVTMPLCEKTFNDKEISEEVKNKNSSSMYSFEICSENVGVLRLENENHSVILDYGISKIIH